MPSVSAGTPDCIPANRPATAALRVCDRRAASGDIAEAGSQRLQRVQISSRACLATHRQRCARASPQVATRQHVEERHERDKAEQGPRQLRTAPDLTAGRQVNPYEDHGDGMEETDQELEDLLHYLNLPGGAAGACPVPALGCQERAAVRRRYAVFAGPADEEPGAPSVTPCAAGSQVRRTSSCRGEGCPGHQAQVAGQRLPGARSGFSARSLITERDQPTGGSRACNRRYRASGYRVLGQRWRPEQLICRLGVSQRSRRFSGGSRSPR